MLSSFLCALKLMLNAVNLLLVAFSAHRGDAAGQVFVFFIMLWQRLKWQWDWPYS
jgi:NADH:ubiquinone oxidoreductase subunit K